MEEDAKQVKLAAPSLTVYVCKHVGMLLLLVLVPWYHYRGLSAILKFSCSLQSLCRWLLQHEKCASHVSRYVFEVPDTFKVKETDKEGIRDMENEIEIGRGELSGRQNQE